MNESDDQQFENDAEDGENVVPSIAPGEVIAEIADSGVSVPLNHLRALSNATDEIVGEFVSLWPRLAPERRREVLASLQQLSDDDATLDFHRIHLSALRDADAATRILAVRGLWEQDRVEYMRLLLDQLRDDPEASVRAAATDALGQWVIGAEFGLISEDDADHLSSVLREAVEDPNEEDEVSGRALEALGARSHESVAEVIGEAYEAGTLRLRLAAVRAMGRNAADEWLQVLIYTFDDEDADVRAAAATSAGQLLIETAVDPLVALLEDEDEDVQVAAIHALGEIAGDDVERILTAVMGRPEEHLARAAREALDEAHMLSTDFADASEDEQ